MDKNSRSTNESTAASSQDGSSQTRTWRRTSLYMLQDLKIMLGVKTYIYAKGDKPIGTEMLLCHYSVESSQLDWAGYDRLIMLSGTEGVIPLADSVIGLILENGRIVDAELGKSRNDYFFKMGGMGDEKRKMRIASGRLRARQRPDDVSGMLSACLASFGFDQDDSPKLIARGKEVNKDDGPVKRVNPNPSAPVMCSSVRANDSLTYEGEELRVLNEAKSDVQSDDGDVEGACAVYSEPDFMIKEHSSYNLSKYVDYLSAREVDTKVFQALPDEKLVSSTTNEFFSMMKISDIGEMFHKHHDISKVSVRDLDVWYVSVSGILKGCSQRGNMYAIVEVESDNSHGETRDVMIGLVRE